jgi:hypothetical protein
MKQINEQLEIVEFDHKLWSMELTSMRSELELYIARLGRLIESTKNEDESKELVELLDGMTKEKQVAETLLQDIEVHRARTEQVINANGEVNALAGHSHGSTRKAMGIARVDFAELQEKFHLYSAGEG